MRLLLVEDEKRMAQALCEILRLEKYEVDHYDNGIDGLAAIESNVYDIVILEVMLPCADNFQKASVALSSDGRHGDFSSSRKEVAGDGVFIIHLP